MILQHYPQYGKLWNWILTEILMIKVCSKWCFVVFLAILPEWPRFAITLVCIAFFGVKVDVNAEHHKIFVKMAK